MTYHIGKQDPKEIEKLFIAQVMNNLNKKEELKENV
jgi:hypothetical protein|tara:strand:+ start:309 stop:416 length:108 start_codon:yes stop_codon:yes gene_type:complete